MWNSKNGELSNEFVSDDEYWSLFNYVFSDSCKKTSTYKFALIKSILDNLLNNQPCETGQQLSFDSLFAKFAESYWNLVVKYHLYQQKPTVDGHTSKIEQIFFEATIKNPILASLEFASIEKDTQHVLISKVQAECKKYVIGALCSDFDNKVYGFNLDNRNDAYILLSEGAYQFMLKYKVEIEKLNYYSWAKYLENINEEKVLFKILTKLELSLPERSSLEVYRNILFNEFEQNTCFYCGKKLIEKVIHVDHFIPWSFVKEDKIWNFVLSCPECNIKKSNHLPGYQFVKTINSRNHLMSLLEIPKNIQHEELLKRQFTNYSDFLIEKLWKYANNGGLKIISFPATYTIKPAKLIKIADSGNPNQV